MKKAFKKTSFLFSILALLLCASYSKPQANSSLSFVETRYDNLNYFTIKNQSYEVKENQENYYTFFYFTFKTLNTKYYISFSYMNSKNEEVYYINNRYVNNYLSPSNMNYNISINIPFNKMADIIRFNLEINVPLFHHKRSVTYYLTNFTNKINLSNRVDTKLFMKYEISNTSIKNYYYDFSYFFFIQDIKDIFYYDKFSFVDRYIYCTRGNLFNGYLYIKDPINAFKAIGKSLNNKDVTLKYIPMKLSLQNNYFYGLSFKNTPYFNPVSNRMYPLLEDGYKICDSAIYMPIKYYSKYKKSKVGVQFSFTHLVTFTIYFEFEVTFQEHYLKNESNVHKDYNLVTPNDTLEDIIL